MSSLPFPLLARPADDLLADLLAVSLTGVVYYTPLYGPAGELTDFAFAYLNPAAQRLLQLPECPTQTHLQQWPHSPGPFAVLAEAFTTGEARHYSGAFLANGTAHGYRLAARRSGEGLLVSFTDAAALPPLPAEAALRESQAREQAARAEAEAQRAEESREELQRFKFMADQAHDAFILMREDSSFAYLNTQALAAWGYSAEEAEHLRVPDVDALYQQAAFGQLFAQAQQELVPQFETLHRHKDGHVFPVEVSVTGLQLGGYPHLLAVARDITAQKQALEALRESEARFRIMADVAPTQIWAVNPDATVRYVNHAFLAFVGLTLEEYLAAGWTSFLHPDELDLAQHTLEEAIRTRTVYKLEHRMRRHDGEYRWLLAQGAPSYYPNGDLYGYVGAAIDITDLKHTNEQLVRTNVDLDTFIYTASHDLRAPISNIEGLLYMLRGELPAPSLSGEVSHILALMQQAVERFKKTIEHLTDVSKLQKEHDQPSHQVLLAPVLADVLHDLAPLLQQTQGRIAVEVHHTPTLTFSEKNLRSVLYNLLSNALKYHHPDRPPEVRVRSRPDDQYVVLEVQDNGLGFDMLRQRQLFAMFQRLHTHVEGSGVGLYMIKRMVENAGGHIEVQSQVGVGSTFRVYFKP